MINLGHTKKGAKHAPFNLHTQTLNKHAIITGSTGTGKTSTIKTLIQELNAADIGVIAYDVKGDLSGLFKNGSQQKHVQEYAKTYQIDMSYQELQDAHYHDDLTIPLYKLGYDTISKMLGLSSAQASVLSIVMMHFENIATVEQMIEALFYFLNNRDEIQQIYGYISKMTISALIRTFTALQAQDLAQFMSIDAFDPLYSYKHQSTHIINVKKQSQAPELYQAMIFDTLSTLYNKGDEVGDRDLKTVIFIDEAHLLFTTKTFNKDIERIIRLIRSKGVGVVFITQAMQDIPKDIAAQLGTKIQHALRVNSDKDLRNLRDTAKSYDLEEYKTIQDTIKTLPTGRAIVQSLAPNGTPQDYEIVQIKPSTSLDSAAIVQASNLFDKIQEEKKIKLEEEYKQFSNVDDWLDEELQQDNEKQAQDRPKNKTKLFTPMPQTSTFKRLLWLYKMIIVVPFYFSYLLFKPVIKLAIKPLKLIKTKRA